MKTRNIVPSPSSQRAITSNVRDNIPLDLYRPVAEIIGYVMRLKRGRSVGYSTSRGGQ